MGWATATKPTPRQLLLSSRHASCTKGPAGPGTHTRPLDLTSQIPRIQSSVTGAVLLPTPSLPIHFPNLLANPTHIPTRPPPSSAQVVKLDIDNTPLESQLIEQVRRDPKAIAMISEVGELLF